MTARRSFMPLGFTIIGLLLWHSIATAHLPAVEPERWRNDNHFTSEGFAQPVEPCLITPQPGDDECDFIQGDDWSFINGDPVRSNPFDIIEETRVPQPGFPFLPGSGIPCTTDADCPLPPAFPGGPPGQGQCLVAPTVACPGAFAECECNLAPGSIRTQASVNMESTLVGPDDVDWAIYNYEARFGEQAISTLAQVPACKENIRHFPTVAIAGPLQVSDGMGGMTDLVDSRTGQPVFGAPTNDLPGDILANLPAGYGIRVIEPAQNYVPKSSDPRPGFFSPQGQNAWLFNKGTQEQCLEEQSACVGNPDVASHFDHNDTFFIDPGVDVTLYTMVWDESGDFDQKDIRDVAVVFGNEDRFTPGDFAVLGIFGKASGNGRHIHGKCSDPIPGGKVDIIFGEIED